MLKVISNKYLGIDFGFNNVGIAISDEGGNMVFMRGVLKGGGKLVDIFEKIYRICHNDGVNAIVFGVPYGPEGRLNAQAERMIRIGKSLREYLKDHGLHVKMVFEDESFTTFNAESFSESVSDTKFTSVHTDHEVAAKLILEKYLGIV